jgi:hypothetical protein
MPTSVRCWPKAEAQVAFFSVSFGVTRQTEIEIKSLPIADYLPRVTGKKYSVDVVKIRMPDARHR